jgi:DNA-binding PadR family transcriptional regulator
MSRDYSPEQWHGPQEPLPRKEKTRHHEADADGQEIGRSGGTENQSRMGGGTGQRESESRTVEPRQAYSLRDRTYSLRSSELETMADVGQFRAVDTHDLAEFAYGGNRRHLEADLANLRKQGLIAERKAPHRETGSRRLVALTKEGQRLLRSTKTVAGDQALYHDFTKPREADHDADLYRLYQRGLETIVGGGGRPVRVVLDAELKRDVYRDVARLREKRPLTEAREEAAEYHGLQVVRGKIPVPDLRIEYETQDGELERMDLELATEHYRSRSLGQKARAGFSLYARPQDASNLRRVLDQQEITAEILNL